MLQSTTMTYLIIGNERKNIYKILTPLISKLWRRELSDDEVLDVRNPDIHLLDGNTLSSIGIEDIKDLQKEMVFSPFKEKVQIAYILDAQKLTLQAQNSLLKTLEESNKSTAYILITGQEKYLLPTVLSRCLKLYTKEYGNMSEVNSDIVDFLNLDISSAFQKIEEISKEKDSTITFLRDLEIYFQSLLKRNLNEKRGIIREKSNIEQVLIAQKRINANGNKRLVLENLFIHLIR